jgi:hypothetical protein
MSIVQLGNADFDPDSGGPGCIMSTCRMLICTPGQWGERLKLCNVMAIAAARSIRAGSIRLLLVTAAYFRPRGTLRALALFLVTYCLLASLTEVGFTDASTYLLELTLAASLLVPNAAARRQA